MIDLQLDTNQDLVLSSGDLALVQDGAEVAQSFKIRLLHILGEWVFDFTLGTDWFSNMFSTSTTKAQKEQEIRTKLINTRGVRRVLQLEFFVDNQERAARVEFTVDTDFGTISSELTI